MQNIDNNILQEATKVVSSHTVYTFDQHAKSTTLTIDYVVFNYRMNLKCYSRKFE